MGAWKVPRNKAGGLMGIQAEQLAGTKVAWRDNGWAVHDILQGNTE